jgi:type II secretory pathway pseudopilin PulG
MQSGQVEGISVLKTLGWVTVGLIVVAAIWAWLVPERGTGDYAALTGRVSQIEESQEAFANKHADAELAREKHAELARQAAALQEQVSALSHALDEMASQQSSAVAPTPADSIDEPNPESTGAFLNDNSSFNEEQAVPRSLRGIATTPGQVLIYQVTGLTGGSVWGTDIYTDDSSIAAAAVHAGLLQPDETGTIMLTILAGRETYRGSARNGVASKDYPSWARSYTLQRLQ